MFGLLLRTGTYYVLWQKFRQQFVMLLVSAVLLAFIFGIYNDLFSLLKISNQESIIKLLLVKWALVLLIIGVNVWAFRRKKASVKKTHHLCIVPTQEEILSASAKQVLLKKTLLSTSDLILAKYDKKKKEAQ